jgi:hypothetical protein
MDGRQAQIGRCAQLFVFAGMIVTVGLLATFAIRLVRALLASLRQGRIGSA